MSGRFGAKKAHFEEPISTKTYEGIAIRTIEKMPTDMKSMIIYIVNEVLDDFESKECQDRINVGSKIELSYPEPDIKISSAHTEIFRGFNICANYSD